MPVSATRKLAPVMPTSAARNFSRSIGARLGQESAAARERSRSGGRSVCDAAEICLDLRPALRWTAGAMMWLGSLVAELDDVFAEIGLDRRDAVRLQVVVEPDLLGDHRLALGDGARAGLAADVER